MSFFITDVHTDLRNARLSRRGTFSFGQDLAKGAHKRYPRMEQIPLPAPAPLSVPLVDAIKERYSAFSCALPQPLSRSDMGTLLGHALGTHEDKIRRNYPSGGGLYPVETYVLVAEEGELRSGVYHYNPIHHTLERLWDIPPKNEVVDLVRGPENFRISALIVFTGVWDRAAYKYGDFAYELALLEAGHMSQNILLTSSALSWRARPLVAFDDPALVTLLDLDERDEQIIQTVMFAKPSPGEVPEVNRPPEESTL
jgi:SagB-type dehydrogenase family enzyme